MIKIGVRRVLLIGDDEERRTVYFLLLTLRQYYPDLSWIDLVIAGLEELLNQNRRPSS